MSARKLAVAVVSCITFASAPAGAQGKGFALDRFEPAERGSDWFAGDSLDLRGHLRPAAGLVVDGAYRPLAIYAPDGSLQQSVVEHQIFGHVGGALVLWERVRVGANVPVALYQTGDQGSLGGVTYAPPGAQALGDVRLGGDVRIVGEYGDPFSFGVGVRAWVPSGSSSDFTGDGTGRLEERLEVAGTADTFQYSAFLGAQYRPLTDSFAGSSLGSLATFGASAGLRMADGALLVGPEVYGSTVVSSNDTFFKTRSTPVEAILGAHWTVARDFRIGAGGGPGLTRGYGSPVARWLVSFEWAPAYEKPAEPAPPAKSQPEPEPAPEPQPPPPPPDRDGDGVPDADDACPDVKGVKTDDPKTNGCPPDRDHDGIVDSEDACPDVAGVKTNDPKTNGCPPDPDRDKDGIKNEDDACPDEPGPPNPDPKKNGCPKAFVQGGQIRILDQVKFATDSAAIVASKDSEDVLNAVLKVLQEHAELKKVRVEGHTDSNGAHAHNVDLSARRAASVVKWLVAHGIDIARLESEGFGPDKPIADNKTAEGRKENRRVEFHIVEGAP